MTRCVLLIRLPTHLLGLALALTRQCSPMALFRHASHGIPPIHLIRLARHASHAILLLFLTPWPSPRPDRSPRTDPPPGPCCSPCPAADGVAISISAMVRPVDCAY